jgi:hypothetical protein
MFSAVAVAVAATVAVPSAGWAASGPGAPVEVVALPSAVAGLVELSWLPPVGDGGSPIIGYFKSYSADGGLTWSGIHWIAPGDGRSATVPCPGLDQDCQFRVFAFNERRQMSQPSSVTPVVQPPAVVDEFVYAAAAGLSALVLVAGLVVADPALRARLGWPSGRGGAGSAGRR